MFRDCILFTAFLEADKQISYRHNVDRVKEYQSTSRADGLSDSPLSRSWCGDFVYWVLKMAGAPKLPPAARGPKWNTISCFTDTYPGTDDPRPGDLYLMPDHYNYKGELVPVNHIGLVVDASGSGRVQTVDGNSGDDISLLVKGIGGAYVCRNSRDRKLIKKYLRVCDE